MRKLIFISLVLPIISIGQINHTILSPPIETSIPAYEDYPDASFGCDGDFAFLNLNNSTGQPTELSVKSTCYYQSENAFSVGWVYLNLSFGTTEFTIQSVNLTDPIGTQISNSAKPFNCGENIDPQHDFYPYPALLFLDNANGSDSFTEFSQANTYVGFRSQLPDGWHYGWMQVQAQKTFVNGVETILAVVTEYAIEETPETPIEVCSTGSFFPTGLQQVYNPPYGILLTWTPYTNSVACQVRGGLEGGADPHNFIVQGTEPTELFINGNGLTIGENYQWKVRCATGLNPYSGVTPWSNYHYFIYDP